MWQGHSLSKTKAQLCWASGLIAAGSIRGKQYGHASSQPSSPTRGTPPLSPTTKGQGKGAFQPRATDGEEIQALEPEGSRVLSALMEGIQSDFLSLVRPCCTVLPGFILIIVCYSAVGQSIIGGQSITQLACQSWDGDLTQCRGCAC